ncbi:uncharacterized protein LOC119091871 [Pollicipes pollicipes]|nr:uncharacterized protein LOC119091871 [Pollicipes pollicipes]
MTNAAERLREMREREAPTLLGLQRRSPSPPRHRAPSRSPEHEIRMPVASLLSDTHGQHEFSEDPRSPEVDSRDGGASRDVMAAQPNNDAEDLSMPAVKMEYTEGGQSVPEAASA